MSDTDLEVFLIGLLVFGLFWLNVFYTARELRRINSPVPPDGERLAWPEGPPSASGSGAAESQAAVERTGTGDRSGRSSERRLSGTPRSAPSSNGL